VKINNKTQYNEELGKFKLLSGTGGVGSIFTTKFNNYVLIKSNSTWGFIENANNKIIEIINSGGDIETENYSVIRNMGLTVVQDKRFIDFLKSKKRELEQIKLLLEVPTLNLTESNYIEWENGGQNHLPHPSAVRRDITSGNEDKAFSFSIQGINFPSWFMNKNGDLKKINDWKQQWETGCSPKEKNQFAPPKEFIERRENGQIKYGVLTQNNLMLICPNGHLSDVPWSKYLSWFQDHKVKDVNCNMLFEYQDCCDKPKLKWTENKSRSLGFESVFIHCETCGKGKSNTYSEKVNLRGIMGLAPLCRGEKPWELYSVKNDFCNKYHNGSQTNEKEGMKFVLATANNVYYSNVESSLYIPLIDEYADLRKAEKIFEQRYQDECIDEEGNEDKSRIDFFNSITARALERSYCLSESKSIETFKRLISNQQLPFDGDIDLKFRNDEFRFFVDNKNFDEKGLTFKSIPMTEDLEEYFKNVKIIEELQVTSTQLEFSRIQPPYMVEDGEGNITASKPSQKVYHEGTHVLPAIKASGEGIFFEFDQEKIERWIVNLEEEFKNRFSDIFNAELSNEDQGFPQRNRAKKDNYKLYLIHSFAHAFIRELEFSCGYPSASIRERLYISNDEQFSMQGFLIYTTEGAEGSMGGIITQCSTSEKVMKLVKNAMKRAFDCTSDPLCWEADKQGVFDLNRSACFSCSLLSETSCEMMNLCLDRRVLVDEEFGYFKELIH
jgi:hypothetical protein